MRNIKTIWFFVPNESNDFFHKAFLNSQASKINGSENVSNVKFSEQILNSK